MRHPRKSAVDCLHRACHNRPGQGGLHLLRVPQRHGRDRRAGPRRTREYALGRAGNGQMTKKTCSTTIARLRAVERHYDVVGVVVGDPSAAMACISVTIFTTRSVTQQLAW